MPPAAHVHVVELSSRVRFVFKTPVPLFESTAVAVATRTGVGGYRIQAPPPFYATMMLPSFGPGVMWMAPRVPPWAGLWQNVHAGVAATTPGGVIMDLSAGTPTRRCVTLATAATGVPPAPPAPAPTVGDHCANVRLTDDCDEAGSRDDTTANAVGGDRAGRP